MSTAVSRKLDNIKNSSGIKAREVAQLLATTPQTVSRWQTGRTSPQPQSLERLLKLEWIGNLLAAIYEPDEARLWIFSPHPELGGRRPADLLAENEFDGIMEIIDRLQSPARAAPIPMNPAIDEIKVAVTDVMRRHGVTWAGVFGSMARGTATDSSDADFLVEFESGRSLLDLVGLRMDLEKALHRKVDVATRGSLHPELREQIMSERIQIL